MGLPALVWAFAVGPIVLLFAPLDALVGTPPSQQMLTAALLGTVVWVSAYCSLRDWWGSLA